jgi:hypothetical protein
MLLFLSYINELTKGPYGFCILSQLPNMNFHFKMQHYTMKLTDQLSDKQCSNVKQEFLDLFKLELKSNGISEVSENTNLVL